MRDKVILLFEILRSDVLSYLLSMPARIAHALESVQPIYSQVAKLTAIPAIVLTVARSKMEDVFRSVMCFRPSRYKLQLLYDS